MPDWVLGDRLTAARRHVAVAVIAVIGILLTIATYLAIRSAEEQARHAEAARRVATHANVLQGFIDEKLQRLRFAQILFANAPAVDPVDFKRFARGISDDFAGVRAVSWLSRVPGDQRDAFEAAARWNGQSQFRIREYPDTGGGRSPARDIYFPILQIEPQAGNEPLIGVDVASRASRREALLKAIATRSLSVTAAATLVGPLDHDAIGVIAIVPIFPERDGTAAPPMGEPIGAVTATYPIGEFLEAALTLLKPAGGLDIYVTEVDAYGQERLLYFHPSQSRAAPIAPRSINALRRGWFEETKLRFADRTWNAVFVPVDSVYQRQDWPADLALGIGLLLTLLLALYAYRAATERERVAQLVVERTSELSQVNTHLQEKIVRLKATEQALRETHLRQQQFAAAAEREHQHLLQAMASVPDGVALFDADDRLVFCNHRYRELFPGVEDEIRPGMPFETLLRVAAVRGLVKEAAGRLESWIAERLEARHEVRSPIELSRGGRLIELRRHRAPDGGVFSVLVDITDARRQEEQLRQSQKMEAVGTFAGGIAHEFNNVLGIIRGYADLAKAFSPADSPVCGHVSKIIKSVERASAVTKALLSFSRKRAPATKVVDLARLVEEQQFLLKPLLKPKIDVEIESDGAAHHVRIDPDLFAQVIMNLAINARDAMPDGGQFRIRVDAAAEDAAVGPAADWVRMTVSDTGVGMDGETARRIFEPFFTTKGQGKGTGLGLSMVYGAVTEAAGSIKVDTAPGRGTSFAIYLPAAEVRTADAAPTAASANAAQPIRLAGRTVLLAEDEPLMRTLLADALTTARYRVLAAANGEEALELFDDNRIDVLVTDVVMPELDGVKLAGLLTDIRPDLPVIYITGVPGRGTADSIALPEDATVLFKPFPPMDLIQTVDAALGASSAQPPVLEHVP